MFNLIRKFLNKPKFKVGDTVICINDRDWNDDDSTFKLIYYKSYKVIKLEYLCCDWIVDIGASCDNGTICDCNAKIPGLNIHWARANRFKKSTEIKEELEAFASSEDINIKIEELVAAEEYELAHELSKKIKQN